MKGRSFRYFAIRTVFAVLFLALGYMLRTVTVKTTSTAGNIKSRIITVAKGTAQTTISASGILQPATQQVVSFSGSGTVSSVDVSVGQSVTSGQPLASLSTLTLSANLAQAQAQLSSDQARLSADESSGASSATIAADQASVSSATSNVDTAQQSLNNATITAPFAGTVVSQNYAVGQTVSANSSSSNGGINIISPNSWIVTANVSDASISQVQTGEQVSIVPQGSSTAVYGTVADVGLIAQDASGVATFPVTVSVTGSPKGLYDGLPANVTITTSVSTNVIEIPLFAVHSLTSTPYVMEVTSSGDKKVSVTIGKVVGANVTVAGGLKVGDRIVERVPNLAKLALRGGRGGFGGGGFGGGGFGGGGFGGGGFGGGAG